MSSLSRGHGGVATAASGVKPGLADVDDDVFEYWAGNPSVEIAHGHIRAIGGHGAAAVATASSSSEAPDGPLAAAAAGSCVALATSVPCYMSAPEFCEFVGAFGEDSHRNFRHCRVLHGQSPEEYLIALWLVSAEATAALIRRLDGQPYNALEAGRCEMRRVLSCMRNVRELPASPSSAAVPSKQRLRSTDGRSAAASRSPVQAPVLHASPLHSPVLRSISPPSSSASTLAPRGRLLREPSRETQPCDIEDLFDGGGERAFCPVCLENIDANPASYQLTELGGGVPLTILCGHTFHARCLSRWCDATCPVCRFQQHPDQTSSCDVCGQSEGLHICLVCGFIGCTSLDEYADDAVGEEGIDHGHALQHFKATHHTYALEVSTQRVWDYAGRGYVHRLLYNHQDGKMVEHSMPLDQPWTPTMAGDSPTALDHLSWPGSEAEVRTSVAIQSAPGVGPVLQEEGEELPSRRPSEDCAGGGMPSAAAASAETRPRWADMVDSGDFGPLGMGFGAFASSSDTLSGAAASEELSSFARSSSDVKGSKKQHSVVSEFNVLLASQMTAQRKYYEERQRAQEVELGFELAHWEQRYQDAEASTETALNHLRELEAANEALEKETAEARAEEELSRKQRQQLEALNQKISGEQQQIEVQHADAREQKRAAQQQRDAEVEDLQQQVRDLELYIQMRRRCEKSTDAADLQDSHFVVTESEGRGRGRGGKRNKRHGT